MKWPATLYWLQVCLIGPGSCFMIAGVGWLIVGSVCPKLRSAKAIRRLCIQDTDPRSAWDRRDSFVAGFLCRVLILALGLRIFGTCLGEAVPSGFALFASAYWLSLVYFLNMAHRHFFEHGKSLGAVFVCVYILSALTDAASAPHRLRTDPSSLSGVINPNK